MPRIQGKQISDNTITEDKLNLSKLDINGDLNLSGVLKNNSGNLTFSDSIDMYTLSDIIDMGMSFYKIEFIKETPLQDDINKSIFYLSDSPLKDSVSFFVNGLYRDINIWGKVITLDFEVEESDIITAQYIKIIIDLDWIIDSDINQNVKTKYIDFFNILTYNNEILTYENEIITL